MAEFLDGLESPHLVQPLFLRQGFYSFPKWSEPSSHMAQSSQIVWNSSVLISLHAKSRHDIRGTHKERLQESGSPIWESGSPIWESGSPVMNYPCAAALSAAEVPVLLFYMHMLF